MAKLVDAPASGAGSVKGVGVRVPSWAPKEYLFKGGIVMKTLIKPKALKVGDTIASVSLSFGFAGMFPKRYQQGVKQIEETFGIRVIPSPHALCSPEELYNHPDWRLEDMMWAFENPDVRGIITNLGGDDAIRLLPLMSEKHFEIIHNNPKIFMGFSDLTVNHMMCFEAGLGTFYSPSLLFGYAESGGIPAIMIENMKKTLFSNRPIGLLSESKEFIVENENWNIKNPQKRKRIPSTPWRYIQGDKTVSGPLIGGCIDVLMNTIIGTTLWPKSDAFNNAILFLDTSSQQISVNWILYWIRNLGAQGILDHLSGILFARPGSEHFKNKREEQNWIAKYPEFDKTILKGLKEFGRTDLPVVTNMDFGHTIPQLILPYGVKAEINPKKKTVSLLESGVV